MIPEPIGERIAAYRQKMGWTQQALAYRLGISRVAVSHIEADISVPGERTITLLAGLFKTPPHELVKDTTYPQAKADRLPRMVCSYTPFEMTLALFENDMDWLGRIQGSTGFDRIFAEVQEKWARELSSFDREMLDDGQRKEIEAAKEKLNRVKSR